MKKILHVSAADGGGGAARAAFRVHQALRTVEQETGISSHMLVQKRTTLDSRVLAIKSGKIEEKKQRISQIVARAERRSLTTENRIIHSTARHSTRALSDIREFAPDAVVLHWLGNSSLSIEQVGRLSSGETPIFWMLHDTWAFCGAEHYPHKETDRRFVEGYRADNRPKWESGLDINRRTWERKRRHWKRPIHIIAPSRWMAELAGMSALMADWPVDVVPYPMDLEWWGGLNREEIRSELGIDHDERVILFGAMGGEKDPRKGADLLREALILLSESQAAGAGKTPKIMTFGGSEGSERFGNFSIRSLGRLNDEELRRFYTAADVVVVPSRIDNLPQTAMEAIACGTPVVGFRTGGMSDIVVDAVTGRLVEPFSTSSLAGAIEWVLRDESRRVELGHAARLFAARWNNEAIALRLASLISRAPAAG